VLDDLDVVSWGDLTGAYGPAADAAMILRGLASPDKDIASEALDEFFSTFWHQGTVYPVTAAAVPFLVDLVTGAAVHHRNALCFALGGIGDPHMSDGAALPAVKAALGVHFTSGSGTAGRVPGCGP
jgi:hypothetical protein